MFGQQFVYIRIVRGQQIEHAAIFPHDAVEEKFRLPAHGQRKVLVEVGKQERVRLDAVQVLQMQPLRGEDCSTATSARGSASMRRTCFSSIAWILQLPWLATVRSCSSGAVLHRK